MLKDTLYFLAMFPEYFKVMLKNFSSIIWSVESVIFKNLNYGTVKILKKYFKKEHFVILTKKSHPYQSIDKHNEGSDNQRHF